MKTRGLVGKLCTKALVFVMAVALIFTMMPLDGSDNAYATSGSGEIQKPVLVATGTGLTGESYSQDTVSLEKSWTLAELKELQDVEGEMYSVRNQKNPYTKSYNIVDGVKASTLIGDLSNFTDVRFLAADGYEVYFKSDASSYTYDNYGTENVPGLASGRYYYDGFDADNPTKEVPVAISWANDSTSGDSGEPPVSKPTQTAEKSYLRLYCGQLSEAANGYGSEDKNGQLLNGGSKGSLNKIIVGNAVEETVLTVGSKEYTRSELLLKDFMVRDYTYETKGGTKTSTAKGVPFSVLLAGEDDSSLVSFETADGFDMSAASKTVKELKDGNYMLAYEVDGNGVYDTAKNDSSKYGLLSLYGDGAKPSKMVNKVTVTKASGVDFSTSPYKHVTNGGKEGSSPYKIDAITGATLTIEGPGMKGSTPLSVKDLESNNGGCFRGVYSDTRSGGKVERTYEGVDLYYILKGMGGDSIKMTDKAYKVTLKNRNRKNIATLTLDEIEQMHNAGKPAIVAYGTAAADGTNPRPFVFNGATGEDEELGNGDGCLKLVYDLDEYGDQNGKYTKFANMAYIYVEEQASFGFKHDKAPYNTAENSQYVLTVTGDELGCEVNYTVDELEKLVEYDGDGKIVNNGYGHRDDYSLANSSYWYVNTYEGVKLWELLLHSGLDKSKASDNSTKVTFKATDNYTGFDTFTLAEVADPDRFGFYEKNAADNNDGNYTPNENIRQGDDVTTGDKLKTGYPILVAYGVNEYPFVIKKDLEGYLSGLNNDGGPLRIISGKREYGHANGSNQAKLLDKIVVGSSNYNYSTHSYQPAGSAYKKLEDNPLKVTISSGGKNTEKNYTVKDLEELIYGGSLNKSQLAEAKVKAFYEVGKNSNFYSDLYEGVNLNYFLKEVVKLTGSQGTVTFKSEGADPLVMNLEDVLSLDNGYNAATDLSGLSPVIAYAKNGYPLVNSKNEEDGYVNNQVLPAVKDTEQAGKHAVKNNGGPLQLIFPRESKAATATKGSLTDITEIEINLESDKYAHVAAPYDTYGSQVLTVSGEGTRLAEAKEFTVSALEGNQSLATTEDYSFRNSKGTVNQLRHRGIKLYDFLKSTNVGLKSNADKVLIYAEGVTEPYEFTLSDIRDTYTNTETSKTGLPVMLAYGSAPAGNEDIKDGKPLVTDKNSEGYDASYENDGGPLKLIIGQKDAEDTNKSKCIKNVTAIKVTAAEQTSWNHSSSEVFKSYLDDVVKLKVIDGEGNTIQSKEMTVADIEGMTDIVSQEEITSTSTDTWEGVNFWQFIQKNFKGVAGIEDPITITVKAKDDFSADVVEKVGIDGLKNGVKDGTRRVPVLLAYAMNGYPLASGGKGETGGEGYDSTIGNKGGPMRLMVHGSQGACISEVVEITVKVNGSGQAEPEDKTFEVSEGTSEAGALPLAGIRSTAMDKDGNLWVGTYGGGASYKAKGSEGFVTYNDASDPALESTYVSAVCPDDKGGVWMTQNSSYTDQTQNRGVVYMKDGQLKYYRASDDPETIPNDYVQEIKIDGNGNLWFGSFGGLTKYDPAAGTWQTWDKNDGFPAMSVDNIEFDKNGGIWCGFYPESQSNDGANAFQGGFAYFKDGSVVKSYSYTSPLDSKTSQYRLGNVWIRDIAVDKNGGAWIVASGSYAGMDNKGGRVWYVSAPGADAVEYTGFDLFGESAFKEDSELRMVTVDSDGGLWFGTSKNGVIYAKSGKIENGSLTKTAEYSSETGAWNSSKFDNIYSLDIYGDTVYVGSANGLATAKVGASGGSDEPENPAAGDATAVDAALTVTGDALARDGYFSITGIKNDPKIQAQEKTFKWRNSQGTEGTSTVEGATVENIICDVVGLKKDVEIGSVEVLSTDGRKTTYSYDEIFKADLDGNKAMYAWKENDNKVNTIVIGMFADDDVNKSKWSKYVSKITVHAKEEVSPVEQVQAMIDGLPAAGEVTIDDADAIIAARDAYDALPDSDKAQVTDVDKLEEAEAALDNAVRDGYVEKGTKAIEDVEYTDYSSIDMIALWIKLQKLESDLKKAETAAEAAEITKKIEDAIASTKTRVEEVRDALNEYPVELEAKAKSYNSISLSWTRATQADAYVIYRSTRADGNFKKIKVTTSLDFTDKSLKTGKAYYYAVAPQTKVKDEYVYGNTSEIAAATPVLAKSKLYVDRGKGKIYLKWNKVSGASGYKIYRSTKKSSGFKVIKTVTKGSTVKYTNKNLKRNTKYYFKVRAYRTVDGTKVYGPYTTVRGIKTR